MSVTIAARLPPDATRAKFTAAAVAALAIIALAAGRGVLVPLSLAVLIAFALAPIIDKLREFHVGRLTSIVTAMGVASVVIALLALFLAGQFAELAEASPANGEPMPVWLATSLAEPLLNPFASAGIAVVLAAFLLLHKERLGERLAQFAAPARDFGRHLLTQGLLDLSFGVTIAAGLWLIGVSNFGLWALIGVMLRSVPFVGVAVAALCPLMIDPSALLTGETLLLFLAADGALQLVERKWLPRTAPRLSAVAAVGATIAWSCLWGLTGLLLAAPLTLGAVMLGRQFSTLGFLNRLLAAQPQEEPTWLHFGTRDAELVRSDAAMRALAAAQHELPTRGSRDVIDGTVNELAPAILPPEQNDTAPATAASVLCVAGPGFMDEAAAGLLAEALRRKAIVARVVSFEDTLPANLPRLDMSGVRTLCISCLDARDQDALRRLVRRLRPRARDARVIGGLWSWSAHALMDSRMAECDLITTHLNEAAAHIERLAHETEAAALAA